MTETDRGFPADSVRQKFFEETFDKERDARLAWYNKLLRAGKTPAEILGSGSKASEIYKKKLEAQNILSKSTDLATSEISQSGRSEKPKFCRTTKHTEEDNFDDMKPGMRPPSSNTRSTLYKGVSKDGEGRQEYLLRRSLKIPEDRYEFPVVSSWEYGWGLTGVPKHDIRKPENGRTRIVHDTFYTRTGIPD